MTSPDRDALDRWLRRGDLAGVIFAPDDRVTVLEGDDAGRSGRVISLQALAPEALYVVSLDGGNDDVAVLQSGLMPAD